MGIYKIKNTSDGQVMFNLHADNARVILTSERYTTLASAEGGIGSVRANSPHDNRYKRLTSTANEPYFTLTAANGETIGTSEMYSSTSARDHGIESVKANGPNSSTTGPS